MLTTSLYKGLLSTFHSLVSRRSSGVPFLHIVYVGTNTNPLTNTNTGTSAGLRRLRLRSSGWAEAEGKGEDRPPPTTPENQPDP